MRHCRFLNVRDHFLSDFVSYSSFSFPLFPLLPCLIFCASSWQPDNSSGICCSFHSSSLCFSTPPCWKGLTQTVPRQTILFKPLLLRRVSFTVVLLLFALWRHRQPCHGAHHQSRRSGHMRSKLGVRRRMGQRAVGVPQTFAQEFPQHELQTPTWRRRQQTNGC